MKENKPHMHETNEYKIAQININSSRKGSKKNQKL